MTDNAYHILNYHYQGGNQYMHQFTQLYENNDISLAKRLNKDTEILILNSQIN